jgi:dienelactone hydrolase
MKYFLLALLGIFWATAARAALQTKVIEYHHGDTVLEGYLAWDDSIKDKQPGVLVVHEWKGHNRYVQRRAEMLAGLGYVAFALDMYGKGVHAKTTQEAVALSNKYKNDRKLMRSRAQAGLDVLLKQEQVDPKRIAVIGYCFGGTTALELARSGADLAGVVAFHAGLITPNPADAKNIKGKVLVLHGADDPFVKPDEVAAFEKEMRDTGVDWQLTKYGGAVHSFTNPEAGDDPKAGAAYNEKADRRSWEAMRTFFHEIFGDAKKE